MIPALLRLFGRGFLPGGRSGRLSILMYHNVLQEPDPLLPLVPTVAEFERDMDILKACFNVLPLDEAFERLQQGSLPPRSVVITFDDGYAESVRNAVPVLKRYGFHATWYLVPGLLDGGRMWNDTAIEAIRRIPDGDLDLSRFDLGRHVLDSDQSRAALIGKVEGAFFGRSKAEQTAVAEYLTAHAQSDLPGNIMLSTEEARGLEQSGMGIGSHTANHPVLSNCDLAEAEREMVEGREGLEAIFGRRVDHFAYPVGRPGKDFRFEHAELARKLGMKSAVTTGWGVSMADTDPHQLPRFTPWDTSLLRYTLRMYQNGRFTKPDIQLRGA